MDLMEMETSSVRRRSTSACRRHFADDSPAEETVCSLASQDWALWVEDGGMAKEEIGETQAEHKDLFDLISYKTWRTHEFHKHLVFI